MNHDPIDFLLYRIGARTDWALNAVNEDCDCAAFSMKGDTHTVFLVRLPRGAKLVPILNHEVLHIVLNRLGLVRASNHLDRISNRNGKYRHLLGGL
jgi:hypothetical protein